MEGKQARASSTREEGGGCKREEWRTARCTRMGGGGSKRWEGRPVWPPGWLEIPEGPRLIARNAILAISSMSASDFLTIAAESYVVPEAEWNFEEFHSAAAAAIQEDIKLNKLTYALVPRRLDESSFWRLYFSKVLWILDCIKAHGTYPPPEPSPPPPEQAAATRVEAKPDSESCAVQ